MPARLRNVLKKIDLVFLLFLNPMFFAALATHWQLSTSSSGCARLGYRKSQISFGRLDAIAENLAAAHQLENIPPCDFQPGHLSHPGENFRQPLGISSIPL